MKHAPTFRALVLLGAFLLSATAHASPSTSLPLPKGETRKGGSAGWLPVVVGGTISLAAIGAIMIFRFGRRSGTDTEVSDDRQFNALNDLAARRPNRTAKLLVSALLLIGMIIGGYYFRSQIADGIKEIGTAIITPFLHVTPRPSSS